MPVDSPSSLAPSRPPAGCGTPKVLVVEDDPQVARAIAEMLRIGHRVDVDIAADGLAAFELLGRIQYVMVISDLRMPQMNGTELYLWLCEAQPALSRRFIFMTAFPGDRHFDVNLAEWGVPILAKPFTMAQLGALCSRHLSSPDRHGFDT